MHLLSSISSQRERKSSYKSGTRLDKKGIIEIITNRQDYEETAKKVPVQMLSFTCAKLRVNEYSVFKFRFRYEEEFHSISTPREVGRKDEAWPKFFKPTSRFLENTLSSV